MRSRRGFPTTIVYDRPSPAVDGAAIYRVTESSEGLHIIDER